MANAGPGAQCVVEGVIAPSGQPKASRDAGKSALNTVDLKKRRQRHKLRVKKLEKKLEVLNRQIQKCAEAELTMDEMNSGYSAYMKEDYLKRSFVRTWQEICRLKRIDDGIVVEEAGSGSYAGTPYPEVNRRVQKLLQLGEFPDYGDISQLLDRCNAKHRLGIMAEERDQLALKVFKEVGKLMKRRRHRDFVGYFGSHLTDGFRFEQDPALQNEPLQAQLQESLKEGERKLAAIVEEFVQRQMQERDPEKLSEGDSCSNNESEPEEEEEEEEEENAEVVVNVVDESSSETEMIISLGERHKEEEEEDEEEGEDEEEEEEECKADSSCQPSSSVLEVSPDSTVPETLVTTSHRQHSPDSVPGPVCFLAPSELPTPSGLPDRSVSGQHVPAKLPGQSISGQHTRLALPGPLVSGQRAPAIQATQNSSLSCTEVINIDDEVDETDLIIITDSESS